MLPAAARRVPSRAVVAGAGPARRRWRLRRRCGGRRCCGGGARLRGLARLSRTEQRRAVVPLVPGDRNRGPRPVRGRPLRHGRGRIAVRVRMIATLVTVVVVIADRRHHVGVEACVGVAGVGVLVQQGVFLHRHRRRWADQVQREPVPLPEDRHQRRRQEQAEQDAFEQGREQEVKAELVHRRHLAEDEAGEEQDGHRGAHGDLRAGLLRSEDDRGLRLVPVVVELPHAEDDRQVVMHRDAHDEQQHGEGHEPRDGAFVALDAGDRQPRQHRVAEDEVPEAEARRRRHEDDDEASQRHAEAEAQEARGDEEDRGDDADDERELLLGEVDEVDRVRGVPRQPHRDARLALDLRCDVEELVVPLDALGREGVDAEPRLHPRVVAAFAGVEEDGEVDTIHHALLRMLDGPDLHRGGAVGVDDARAAVEVGVLEHGSAPAAAIEGDAVPEERIEGVAGGVRQLVEQHRDGLLPLDERHVVHQHRHVRRREEDVRPRDEVEPHHERVLEDLAGAERALHEVPRGQHRRVARDELRQVVAVLRREGLRHRVAAQGEHDEHAHDRDGRLREEGDEVLVEEADALDAVARARRRLHRADAGHVIFRQGPRAARALVRGGDRVPWRLR
mmetsp:Transcript_27676/g.85755  ORF Transcript_27676/g.85755 Transcript_27676/m.85755 type:complete len:619 (-) Transcript_27676:1584-3440(-)